MSTPEDRRVRVVMEAAEWLVRFDEGPLTTSEKAQFEAWLRESPLHVAEFLAASRVRRELGTFTGWEGIGGEPPAEPARVHVLSSASRAGEAVRAPHRRSARRVAAIAATVLLLTALSALTWVASTAQQFVTGTGEKREMTLADGSVVRLLPESRLRVAFRSAERRVQLTRGEALFRVAKDPGRPFIVDAGSLSVRAVGTVFSVQLQRHAQVVTVQEGKVLVATTPSGSEAGSAESSAPVPLRANQRLAITSAGKIGPIREVVGVSSSPLEAFDWYGRHIVFTDSPVAEVVADFNRRNHTKIVVTDPALAERRVTGSFADDDPQSFAAFLATIPGVQVQNTDAEIRVGARISQSDVD